jgi:hypothetical protein
VSIDRATFLNRQVATAFLLQVAGYAALLAVYPTGDPVGVVSALQALPAPLLVVVALPAIPATALAIGLGAALSTVGFAPGGLPPLLFARGDVVVFAAAYLLAVAVVTGWRRVGSHGRAPESDDAP